MHDLTGFQRDILAIIADLGRPKGLDIKEEYEDHHGVRGVNHGRLYPNLDVLVERGLVEKGKKDDRTNEYAITGRGESELRDHAEWLGGIVDGFGEE